MTNSGVPQEIIDSIIDAVENDGRLLRACTLVSSSFLLPSRKRLFSDIILKNDGACQRLYQLLVDNPIIQSFIKSIGIDGSGLGFDFKSQSQLIYPSLIAVLQLPFPCLESFSMPLYSSWKSLTSELKDALSTTIHSATLKKLYICKVFDMPLVLFQGLHLTELKLESIAPNDFDTEQSNLLTPVASEGVAVTTSDMVIDHCVWEYFEFVYGDTEPMVLPFMSRLRVLEIYLSPEWTSGTTQEFNFLSFTIRSLRASLTSPATLEHLKLTIEFYYWGDDMAEDYESLLDGLRDDDAWPSLDSIITDQTGSRLQRVDINIKYSYPEDDNAPTSNKTEVEEAVLDALPLLHEKGILFVEATLTVNGEQPFLQRQPS